MRKWICLPEMDADHSFFCLSVNNLAKGKSTRKKINRIDHGNLNLEGAEDTPKIIPIRKTDF